MTIVRYFEKWRSELKRSAFFINVIFDHKNLKYFVFIKQLSRRQIKWSEFLSRFDFKIVYRSEKTEEKSNALIRRSEDLSKEENDTNEQNKYQHQTILKIENLDEKVAKNYLRFILLILIFLDDVEIDANESDSHLEESQLDENLINLDEDVLTQLLWK
jgi:hypothetical protein